MIIAHHVVSLVAGSSVGIAHFACLRRQHRDIALESVHRFTRLPLFLVFTAGLVVTALAVGSRSLDIAWRLPLQLDAISQTLLWAVVFTTAAYVMTLGVAFAWRQRHPRRVRLAITTGALLGALLLLQFRSHHLPELRPAGERTVEGNFLQTTAATCAAASGASIAKALGVTTSEREMAGLMGTTGLGTSVGQIVLGMRKLGLAGKKVVATSADELAAPAMLFIDHEATGPESHAIALVSCDGPLLHVVDPLIGDLRLPPSAFAGTWHGRAIEFRRE